MITSSVIKDVDFLSATGILKKLEPPTDKQKIALITPVLQQVIDDFTCPCCLSLYEKPLYTRICEHPLCVACYMKLQENKCPSCSAVLPENPSEGLALAPRSTINLLNDTIKNYLTISSIESQNQWKLQKGCIDEIEKQKHQALQSNNSLAKRSNIRNFASTNQNTNLASSNRPVARVQPFNNSIEHQRGNNNFLRNPVQNPLSIVFEEEIIDNNYARRLLNLRSYPFSRGFFTGQI